MNPTTTRGLLTVYWDSTIGETSGQTFYASSNDPGYTPADFPVYLWKDGTVAKSYKLFSEGWTVWLWDIRVIDFPDNWLQATEETLQFLNSKALLSWCSLDGYFEDPPSLFDPDMADGYYAATYNNQFVCHTDLDIAYASLRVSELKELQTPLKQSMYTAHPSSHDLGKLN